MPSPSSRALAAIFLLIEHPHQRLSHWLEALAALDSPYAPPVVSVVASYDASADHALLGLHYDTRQFDETARQYVVNVALLAEVGMIQPDRLSENERERFLGARLARCAPRLAAQPTVARALEQLARAALGRRPLLGAKPPPIPPPRNARGTRDNLAPLVTQERGDDHARTSPHRAPRLDHHRTNRLPPRAATPAPVPRGRDLEAIAASPVPVPRGREVEPVAARDLEAHITSPLDLAAFQAMAADRRVPDRIHARYLRGGRWLPARIGSLRLKGAALLADAPPRLGDHVDVALSYGERRVIARGIVAKVSTRREATSLGAAVFTLEFLLDEYARPALTALLVAARDGKVTITPPPPRASRRYPVDWFVALGTPKGIVNATAIDISVGGMFVRSSRPLLLDTTPSIAMALDDGGAPIAGRAKVVRRISEAEANACGLVAGFGLAIIEMTAADVDRWRRFLARIERRSAKRVLIGAPPTRMAELRSILASSGYAVVGGTDPGTLVELANTSTRPADAVLIDASWSHPEGSTVIVEELLASRNVPCVRAPGEVVRAREAIDRLLRVV